MGVVSKARQQDCLSNQHDCDIQIWSVAISRGDEGRTPGERTVASSSFSRLDFLRDGGAFPHSAARNALYLGDYLDTSEHYVAGPNPSRDRPFAERQSEEGRGGTE